jgi:hypothetical protein
MHIRRGGIVLFFSLNDDARERLSLNNYFNVFIEICHVACEAIAVTCNGRDIAGIVTAFAQSLAEG